MGVCFESPNTVAVKTRPAGRRPQAVPVGSNGSLGPGEALGRPPGVGEPAGYPGLVGVVRDERDPIRRVESVQRGPGTVIGGHPRHPAVDIKHLAFDAEEFLELSRGDLADHRVGLFEQVRPTPGCFSVIVRW